MSKTIVITGIAGNVSVSTGEDDRVLRGVERSVAEGADCQDCFSEYMDDLTDVVSGGYMDFNFIEGELMVQVEYESTRLLTDDELHDLIEYTQGQMSDGIGEGFEQYPFKEDGQAEYYVSPWYGGQVLTATQTVSAE